VSHPPSAWKSSSLTIFIRCLVFVVFGTFAALTRRQNLSKYGNLCANIPRLAKNSHQRPPNGLWEAS